MQVRLSTSLQAMIGAAIGIGAATTAAHADDWPQWRGPDHTGVSVETGWSADGATEPLWRAELGFGHASFAIADGRVFTLGYDEVRGVDVVYCLDANTGDEHWRHEYPSEFWNSYHDGGTLTTPTIADSRVYSSNREGKVFCLSMEGGEVIWQRDLRADLSVEPPEWGFSGSPLLVDDAIIMNVGRVAALDAATGETRWVTDKNYGDAYSTPAPFNHAGAPRLAVLDAAGVVVLDRSDGAEVGFHDWFHDASIMPMTPVIIGDDRIFVSAGYSRGCVMLRLTDDGLESLWESRVMRNKMAGAVLFENHLYGFDESILKCVDLDGKELWRKRGLGAGTMSIAGQRLLIIDGKGAIVVAEANSKAYVELSRHEVLEGGTYWSTPVISNGLVYCRNSLGSMACLDYRAGAAEERGPDMTALHRQGPAVPEILARHLLVSGGEEALKALTSLEFSGEGEYHEDAVQRGAVTVRWQASGGFAWDIASGYQYAHNGETGWIRPSGGMPTILDETGLEALVLGGDLLHLLHSQTHYAALRQGGRIVFDDRDCYVIIGETQAGMTRRLYFDADTGLWAGSEGDDEPLWILSDYREVDGVTLPMRWSFFEPELGEMRTATFERVAINSDLPDDAFAPSDMVTLMLRSPEEKEADNGRLRTEYADLLGEWMMVDGPPKPAIIDVADGFMTLHLPMRPERDYVYELNDEDQLVVVPYPFVHLQIERDAAGKASAMALVVSGEVQGRLVRGETGDDGGD